MRRIILAVTATTAGLASVLGFKAHTGEAPVTTTLPAVVAAAPTTAGTASPSGSTATSSPSSGGASGKTVTGDVANFRYGSIQVQITIVDGKVTKAAIVQLNANEPRSAEIDARAVPQLQQETIDATTAQVDTVSGATYTSEAYRESLQSALDRAGL